MSGTQPILSPSQPILLAAIREYVDACIAEADAADEAGMPDEGDLWPESVQDAKRRVNHAYEDLHALATGEHTQRCGIWCELDDVTGLLHAVGTCDCILLASTTSASGALQTPASGPFPAAVGVPE